MIPTNPKWLDEYPDNLPVEEREDKVIECATSHSYCEGCKNQKKCEKILEGEG